ncbi:MAG TPA: carboxypeptidase-like regulatory domain-containing protein [Candidatus Cybelea sp.]
MWYRCFLAISTFFALAACNGTTTPFSPAPSSPGLSGVVTSAAGPVAGSQVTLYRAGNGAPRSGASVLARATSDAKGVFRINYTLPGDGIVYAVAIGGRTGGHSANAAIGLMAIAGRNGRYASVVSYKFVAITRDFWYTG